eukprot:12891726-Prorocentrum_lima.AAC.1
MCYNHSNQYSRYLPRSGGSTFSTTGKPQAQASVARRQTKPSILPLAIRRLRLCPACYAVMRYLPEH